MKNKKNDNLNQSKKVVLMLHGFAQCGESFLCMKKENSIAYQLHKQGYDVYTKYINFKN